jgi:hypothetical protein
MMIAKEMKTLRSMVRRVKLTTQKSPWSNNKKWHRLKLLQQQLLPSPQSRTIRRLSRGASGGSASGGAFDGAGSATFVAGSAGCLRAE